MMKFELTEELGLLRDAVRDFAEKELKHVALGKTRDDDPSV